ncbi:MAG: ATP-binding protein, partial [Anaerolineae bacterium]|nr:ATP-binding protein [Anaerolineae bacterium]
MLERLLAKEAQARYASADETLEALCRATRTPRPQESWTLRENLLTGAQFVGRETEMALLTEAMHQAFAGRGSAWLVGGESGVGKSRLLEELRIQAQIEGALTLYGQAIPEGSVPFRLWHDALRCLLMQATSAQEREWAVLRAILPHTDHKSASFDRQALSEALLALLRYQTSPILLILEDLHWATDSLELLRPLLTEVQDHPWLIVGSYRDD